MDMGKHECTSLILSTQGARISHKSTHVSYQLSLHALSQLTFSAFSQHRYLLGNILILEKKIVKTIHKIMPPRPLRR